MRRERKRWKGVDVEDGSALGLLIDRGAFRNVVQLSLSGNNRIGSTTVSVAFGRGLLVSPESLSLFDMQIGRRHAYTSSVS